MTQDSHRKFPARSSEYQKTLAETARHERARDAHPKKNKKSLPSPLPCLSEYNRISFKCRREEGRSLPGRESSTSDNTYLQLFSRLEPAGRTPFLLNLPGAFDKSLKLARVKTTRHAAPLFGNTYPATERASL